MSKRARYIGGSGTGVTLQVPLADGQTRPVHVEPNHLLPEEIDGQKVPAAFRDSLLDQAANWSSVQQTAGDQQSGRSEPAKSDQPVKGNDQKEG
jgi:hypothetical protein